MDWDSEALYAKARVYVGYAQEQPIESGLFGLWMSLALELLCKSALAKIHPVLVADPREDGNILYAFGVQGLKAPKSIVTKALLARCAKLVDGFTEEMVEHCVIIADRRNKELHSGTVAFDDIDNSGWLPSTYEVMEVLLRHLDRNFTDFMGDEYAPSAEEMLRDRRNEITREIEKKVRDAKNGYLSLSQTEKDARQEKWASRVLAWLKEKSVRRRTTCPACGNAAVLTGDIASRGPVRIDTDSNSIEREVRIVPRQFLCPFCELTLGNYQEVRAAGLGAIYTTIETEDPIEFFSIDPAEYVDVDKLIREYQSEYDNE